MDELALRLIVGLSYGFLLFMLALGLSISFGLMGFINLAHGSFYMLGAYVGISVERATGGFWTAVAAGGLAVAVVGVAMERGLLRRFQGRILQQVLLTFGFAYLFQDAARRLWGAKPLALAKPAMLGGSVSIGDTVVPTYRLGLILIGALLALGTWLVLERTRIGSLVRAGVDDVETLSSLGVDANRVFSAVFGIGAFLSGVGGVLGAPVTGVAPGTDLQMLLLALVVVVVGGLGSVTQTLAGSLLIGVADSLMRGVWPQASLFGIYALMAVLLVVRPAGLLGRTQA
ncbi:branched-chain amino acid ABC transporter permease [Limnochorda pilosa]|uniref:ABC transporter permease n=1 Tax=Limnochorda pilosa TaxID=1555112 RepID=A0A0K2SLM2_LIMPI|nr:branched-chain amino acid ABC transporter permease [Limnochorda pilosa]BAS28005.1 ABC transporter permease [Limnochorda pilosa]